MGTCNNPQVNCDTCFEVLIGDCLSDIDLSLGLSPSTLFFFRLIDKFGAQYDFTATTDVSGDFTVPKDQLPDDLINQFAGLFQLEIYSDSGRTILVVIVQNSIVYNCVILTQELSGSNNLTPPEDFDSDAEAYFTAASITDTREKAAINVFVLALKTGVVWDTVVNFYPISPTSLAAAQVNLKTPGINDITWVNVPTHSSTGVDFNGTTQYGRSGYILTDANNHISTYLREAKDSNTETDLGARGPTSSHKIELKSRVMVGSMQGSVHHNSSARPNTTSIGHKLVVRISVGNSELYEDGVSIGTTSGAAAFQGIHDVWIAGNNLEGVLNAPSTRETAFVTLGGDLNASQILELYNAIQVYQTNVIAGGRNI